MDIPPALNPDADSTSRTLETLYNDFTGFTNSGSNLKNAKNYNNSIRPVILPIPEENVVIAALHLDLGIFPWMLTAFQAELKALDIELARRTAAADTAVPAAVATTADTAAVSAATAVVPAATAIPAAVPAVVPAAVPAAVLAAVPAATAVLAATAVPAAAPAATVAPAGVPAATVILAAIAATAVAGDAGSFEKLSSLHEASKTDEEISAVTQQLHVVQQQVQYTVLFSQLDTCCHSGGRDTTPTRPVEEW